MESDNDKDIRLEDMKRGEHSVCKQKLINLGLPPEHAEIACSALLIKKDEVGDDDGDDFLLLFVDEEEITDVKPSDACVAAKIKIFAHEHPEWKHDQVIAAAHGYCRAHGNKVHPDSIKDDMGDPVSLVGIVGGRLIKGRVAPSGNIPIQHLMKLIQDLQKGKSLKVGHGGIMPFLTSLPMKNLNRLQTKLEKLTTAEAKNLTAEELTRRRAYAKQMKKDAIWVRDEIFIEKINAGLNNIIKAPIVLAKEMTQEYVFRKDDGSEIKEMHFKPYDELKRSVEGIEELPMLIEHHDSWEDDQIIGYVKELVADDDLRAIRGMGYFQVSKLPDSLLQLLSTSQKVGVSIGFMANLGEQGVFDGILYDHAQTDIILEHLAICLESIPRCPLDKCGVNVVKSDSVDFTVINNGNYYYNIDNLLTNLNTDKETIGDINSETKIKSDSMTEDSFADPKSGKISGDETKDFEAMLGRLRKFIAGIPEVIERDMAKKKIQEILHMTDEGEDEPSETLKGEDMDQKEFEDAIAQKDAENTELKELLKEMLISEIKRFADAEKIEKLKLDEKCVHDLKTIRDTVIVYDLPEKEPEIIPQVSPEEHKQEVAEKVTGNKYADKIKELNAEINEEFDLTGIEFTE